MLPVERLDKILKQLIKAQTLKVEDVAREYQISDMTVRRDFEKLEKLGVAKRCYGGISLKQEISLDVGFQQRQTINTEAKQAIAEYCYTHLIGDNQFIYLDAGSTVLHLAQMLRKGHPDNLTIVTNDVVIAYSLIDTNIQIIMMGGCVQSGLGCIHGRTAEEQLNDLHLDAAFVSGLSVDPNFDLYAATEDKVHFRHKLLEQCRAAYMLIDASKLNRQSIFRIHNLSCYTSVVSDRVLSPENAALAQEKGIRWISV